MNFELEPYHRDITKEQVVNDITAVARQLGQSTITTDDYRRHGKYSPDVARRRCGSWLKALVEAGLSTQRHNTKAAPEQFIPDLKRVATLLGKPSVTTEEYRDHGRFAPSTVSNHFGTWFAALDAAGLNRTRTLHVTDEEYFENLEQMWVHLGRQPHYTDVQKPFSRYSAGAYEKRFGSWRKALEAFVVFVNQESDKTRQSRPPASKKKKEYTMPAVQQKPSRYISWRLRFLVMRRDDFKCRICGRSPALQPGLVLHVDHVKAWIKDGETVMDNLQTLCEQCNVGKSDLSMKKEG
ncbi:MAG TPA: HNH endonuclease [Smithella sp.]|jgi:hypothetical protein|nr:HNH endonuclease [Smithella sp.]HPL47030.1 HNH endonuclease [Smithella sp.]HQP41236.1 HNH endonuclease [Smithella sp.]